jgi:plastocyanin
MRLTAAFGTLLFFVFQAEAQRAHTRPLGETGTIEGRITFTGPPPRPATAAQGEGSPQVLYLDGHGGVRYAVVFLPDARGTAPRLETTLTVDQRGFVFVPQVLAARAGQPVRFTNSDPASHNVRAVDAGANTFSINTAPGAVGPAARRFGATSPDHPLALTCDIHPWMAAWIYVFDHDLYAVSKEDGTFRIERVPVGRHRMSIRQPAGRLARDIAVDVGAGATARLDVRFTPTDVGMPAR